MKKIRILSIFNRYLQYGGEETMAAKMASTLSLQAEVEEFNYSTAEWLAKGKLSAPFRGLHNRYIVKKLRDLHKNRRYDVWLIHNVFPAMSPAVYTLAQKLGVPVIHILHNYRFGCLNGLLFRDGKECRECKNGHFMPGIRHRCWNGGLVQSVFSACFQMKARRSGILEYATRFIALSARHAELLQSLGLPSDKMEVIPLFVETHCQPCTAPPADGDILFVGRLTPEKGLMGVIEAWKRLNTERKLVIAGDGPYREELEAYVKNNHLNNVIFKGFVPLEQQASLWESAAAFIAPSTWQEPGATVILEALGRGRPVIAFAKGAACDHLANPAHGWLMDEHEPDILFNTLQQVLNTSVNQLSAMSQQSREFVRTQRSPEAWLSMFMNMLEKNLP